MSDYLYVVEGSFEGVQIAKVGVTGQPRLRLSGLIPVAPLDLTITKLRRFHAIGEAYAWERFLICGANRYRDRGEWVLADDRLAVLWAKVDGGAEVNPDTFKASSARPIPDNTDDENVRLAYVEKLRAKVGPVAAGRIKFSGHPALYDRAIIMARLADGYGVDDIRLIDGISRPNIQREIARLRKTGELDGLYRKGEVAA